MEEQFSPRQGEIACLLWKNGRSSEYSLLRFLFGGSL